MKNFFDGGNFKSAKHWIYGMVIVDYHMQIHIKNGTDWKFKMWSLKRKRPLETESPGNRHQVTGFSGCLLGFGQIFLHYTYKSSFLKKKKHSVSLYNKEIWFAYWFYMKSQLRIALSFQMMEFWTLLRLINTVMTLKFTKCVFFFLSCDGHEPLMWGIKYASLNKKYLPMFINSNILLCCN